MVDEDNERSVAIVAFSNQTRSFLRAIGVQLLKMGRQGNGINFSIYLIGSRSVRASVVIVILHI